MRGRVLSGHCFSRANHAEKEARLQPLRPLSRAKPKAALPADISTSRPGFPIQLDCV